MPFLADLDGDRVIPEQVSGDERVTCLSCGGEMFIYRQSVDGRARHFVHITGSDGCTGESDEHRKMKSLAVSKLRQEFDGEYTQCAPEVDLDISHTESDADLRRADALVEFGYNHSVYGSGLIVEVQFRNKGKEIPIVTSDYIECGYSVYWAKPQDFTESQFRFDRLESAFEANTTFAYAPSRFTEGDAKDFDESDLHWQDPIPDCDHIWKTFDDVEYCARCRINRTYSNDRTRYLYDNMGLLGPLERPDVPEVPEPPEREYAQSTERESTQSTGYDPDPHRHIIERQRRELPHGVPAECDHYNGPEHKWADHWANQDEVHCMNCGVTVDSFRLPDSVEIQDDTRESPSPTEIGKCDSQLHATDEHKWAHTKHHEIVQCIRCYQEVHRSRLPPSVEVKGQISERGSREGIPECDYSDGEHSWADTGRDQDTVQCVKCYKTVDESRLPDSVEVEESWWW